MIIYVEVVVVFLFSWFFWFGFLVFGGFFIIWEGEWKQTLQNHRLDIWPFVDLQIQQRFFVLREGRAHFWAADVTHPVLSSGERHN